MDVKQINTFMFINYENYNRQLNTGKDTSTKCNKYWIKLQIDIDYTIFIS